MRLVTEDKVWALNDAAVPTSTAKATKVSMPMFTKGSKIIFSRYLQNH